MADAGLRPAPRFTPGLAEIAAAADGFVVDQWGVLHDGVVAYPGAIDCAARLKRTGRHVVVLSNSGKRSAASLRNLLALGFAAGDIDGVVTAGEATWTALKERRDPFFAALGQRCLLWSRSGDTALVQGLELELVPTIEAAEFILLAGIDDGTDPARFKPALDAALARDLPLVCANPDEVGVTGTRLFAGPGAIARAYQAMGGPARLVGKPYPEVYELARRLLGGLAPERIVAVGDSLSHDIKGGADAGFQTALVTQGIHAADLALSAPEAERRHALSAMAERHGVAVPDWVIPAFVW